jgi:hypothetical protein
MHAIEAASASKCVTHAAVSMYLPSHSAASVERESGHSERGAEIDGALR